MELCLHVLARRVGIERFSYGEMWSPREHMTRGPKVAFHFSLTGLAYFPFICVGLPLFFRRSKGLVRDLASGADSCTVK